MGKNKEFGFTLVEIVLLLGMCVTMFFGAIALYGEAKKEQETVSGSLEMMSKKQAEIAISSSSTSKGIVINKDEMIEIKKTCIKEFLVQDNFDKTKFNLVKKETDCDTKEGF